MSAPLWLANLAAYSVQVGFVVLACALTATLLRVGHPGVMLRYWRGLLLVSLLLPVLQPWARTPHATGPDARDLGDASGFAAQGAALRWADALALALLLGIAARLLALAAGLWRLRRYRQRARPLDLPAAAALCDRLGLRALLAVTDDLSVPVTFGARRPAILLPARLLEMAPERRTAILCHELLHVRRRDWLSTVAEECVRSLLWFHPAIGWLLGRIRLAREQLVDREVVALTGNRQAYLEALLEVARGSLRHQPLAAPLFLKESHLKDRIDLLLEEVSMSTRRVLAVVGLCVGLSFVSGVLAVRAFPLRGLPDQAASAEKPVGGVSGGVAGGIPAGVAGGVPGGLSGGVAGGIEGGFDDETQTRVDEKVKKPPRKIVHKVDPEFPYGEGKKVRNKTDVVLELTIAKSGEVSDVKLVKGHPAFNASAVDAVKQWKFEASDESPARATVTIRFVPPPPPPPKPSPEK